MESHPAEELLGTDGCWERERMQPPSGSRAPVDSPTPMHTPVALNRYNGREKQGQGGIGCKG